MFDDVDGTRQAWRVPIYADLADDTQSLVNDITAETERLRVVHAAALARFHSPTTSHFPPLSPQHDCR